MEPKGQATEGKKTDFIKIKNFWASKTPPKSENTVHRMEGKPANQVSNNKITATTP